MLKSFKYRIYPSEEQQGKLSNYFGVVRLVYNLGLEVKKTAYESTGKSPSSFDLIKQITELRKDYDWVKDCPSQALQQSIRNLDIAYKNFFKGSGYPKFKNKYSKQSIKFPQGVSVDFSQSLIKLPKLGNISIIFSREFSGDIKTVTLSKTVTGKYFVSILVDNKKELPNKREISESSTVGIDLGVKELAITSEGVIYENKNFLKTQLRRLRVEQRSLSRKQKGSKNREKQKLKVSLLHEKIRNQRIDYLQKITTELINTYDTIVIEDLVVTKMLKDNYLARAISDMGWREFRGMLEYKADWYGKNLLVVDKYFPSSKTCSNCGNIKNDLDLSHRVYECDVCNSSFCRDLNAAVNIKKEGLGQILCTLT